jgi:hypothetical protein
MPDDSTDPDDDARQSSGEAGREPGIVRTTIDPDASTAEFDLLQIIADRENVEIEELPSFYTQIDHMVESLFKDPPSPEAQIELDFTYAGYRIRLTQTGEVTLFNIDSTLGDG